MPLHVLTTQARAARTSVIGIARAGAEAAAAASRAGEGFLLRLLPPLLLHRQELLQQLIARRQRLLQHCVCSTCLLPTRTHLTEPCGIGGQLGICSSS